MNLTKCSMRDHRRARRCLFRVIAGTCLLTLAAHADDGTDLEDAIRNNDSETLEQAVRDDKLDQLIAADGKTILMAAAADNNLSLVEILLSRNTDVRALNNRGGSALMYAAANGSDDVASRLLVAGADVDQRAENGWTALTLASAKGHAEVVDLLLSAGADPNIPDVFGFSALMRATQNARVEVVVRLLNDSRTDARQRNAAQKSAADIARENGDCDIVGLLQRAIGARADGTPQVTDDVVPCD